MADAEAAAPVDGEVKGGYLLRNRIRPSQPQSRSPTKPLSESNSQTVGRTPDSQPGDDAQVQCLPAGLS